MVGRSRPGAVIEASELRALLLLRLVPGLGDRGIARLLERHGSAAAAVAAPGSWQAGTGSRRKGTIGAETHRRVDEVLERCRSGGIRIVPRGDPLYPEKLTHLSDPPPVLFLRGDAALLRMPSATVVGARRATPTGRRTAERLGRDIGELETPVVSGLALGIDAAAHRGAVDTPGGTIAVLGSGPDRPHPPGNRRLFHRILERGLVVSEFLPGEAARPHHFPRRNRILAALSDTVVVVEAGKRSGALITVDHALDMGREVFAVPGSVESPQSVGTNRLLRDGAGVVRSARDLEVALRWGWRKWAEDPGRLDHGWWDDEGPALRDAAPPPPRLAGELRLLERLGPAPRSLEQIVSEAALPPARVLAELTELELRGLARREGSGWLRKHP